MNIPQAVEAQESICTLTEAESKSKTVKLLELACSFTAPYSTHNIKVAAGMATNISGELAALTNALEEIETEEPLTMYTDCISMLDLLNIW
jgi:hypothetical protein